MKRFRGGLVFKAHRLLYHSTLGLRVIKRRCGGAPAAISVGATIASGAGACVQRPQMLNRETRFPAASEKVALYVLCGARCREVRERRERDERGRREREREKRLHSPFALHATIKLAIWGYVIKNRG